MRIHHLNCGSMHPYFPRTRAIVYCLLVETSDGLVLVDTGLGMQDCTHPAPLMRLFATLIGAARDVEETAVRQVVRLGFAPEDVRHIVLTHMNLDHTGGLPDFPGALVHVHRAAYEAALRPHGITERARVPAHWAHGPHWVLHEQPDGEWFGFESIRVVPGLVPDMRLIPLPGHTRGHCGVAIATPTGWLFDCGDAASPYHHATDPYPEQDHPRAVNVLPTWLVRRVIGPHVPRLQMLAREHADEVQLISGHDMYGFARYQAQ
jgi:glyoxylase-like metal-dependent hydrolase (beta-lactamase superfamily II)